VEALEKRQLLAVVVEVEANDTQATSQAVTVATGDILTTAASDWLTIKGNISTSSDSDFYTFTLASRSGVFFDIDAQEGGLGSSLNSFLEVFDGSETSVGSNNDGYDFEGFAAPIISGDAASSDSSLYLELEAGTYAVSVRNATDTSGDYVLRILADDNFSGIVPVIESNNGAADTLYLDFDGHTSDNDHWANRDIDPDAPVSPNGEYTAASFDLDFNNNAAEFSPGERLAMQNIVRVMEEDYSPFKVNVTTVDPGSFEDGVALRMVVTDSDSDILGFETGLLGIANRNSYNSDLAQDNIAFTFAGNFGTYGGGNSGSIMAAALEQGNTSSHEFGHTLTLGHFATNAAEPPAPEATVIENAIMGTPDQGLSREIWGIGTSAGGDPVAVIFEPQDDLAIIGNEGTNAIGFRTDDHLNTDATISVLTPSSGSQLASSGIIERVDPTTPANNDLDFFRFSLTTSALYEIRVDVDEYVNDLNAVLRVYDAAGNLLGTSDPDDSFDAELTLALTSGDYFAEVTTNGDAGEIGQYNITVDQQDRFEANDTVATATVLGSSPAIFERDLTIHNDQDVDYFKVTANQTGMLAVNIHFDHAAGDLRLQVRDANDNLIASVDSITNDETLVIPVVGQQRYYVRVFSSGVGETNTYDLEIENFPVPVPAYVQLAPDSDTGNRNDNITSNPNPSFIIQADLQNFANMGINLLDPTELSNDEQGAVVEVLLGNISTGAEVRGFATQLNDTSNIFWEFTPTDPLTEGEYLVSAAVRIFDGQRDASENASAGFPVTGEGQFSLPFLLTVDTTPPAVSFGTQAIATDGLDATSDSGVPGPGNNATYSDRITNDTTPAFFGYAEAGSTVQVYVLNSGGSRVLLGQTVAVPVAGNLPSNDGFWQLNSTIDLNSTLLGFGSIDGLRELEVDAIDIAGNTATDTLQIFIDTQGPQITNVGIPGSTYDLITGTPGPTPAISQLEISVQDLPNRVTGFLYNALQEGTNGNPAENPNHYQLVGDRSGPVAIQSVVFTPNAPSNGNPATGTITLTFFEPLPDDVFTLTVSDDVVDPAGNQLNGEYVGFPSGNGVAGGDFVVQFAVDGRAEIGTWHSGSVYLDTNGNLIFDPELQGGIGPDTVHTLGFATDFIFAGNFAEVPADAGFDKLAAYGTVNGQFRWLIDVNGDGIPDINSPEPLSYQTIGMPVAGNFDNDVNNGDEIGLYTGTHWLFDTDHDFLLSDETPVASEIFGLPVVGDFDGDGDDDLATYDSFSNTFFFSLTGSAGGPTNASLTDTVQLGSGFPFLGARDRPVVGNIDGDIYDDIGIYAPDRSGVTPSERAEWYFITSGNSPVIDRVTADIDLGGSVFNFTPAAPVSDVFAHFGENHAIPLVGNFATSVSTPPLVDAVTFRAASEFTPADQEETPPAELSLASDSEPVETPQEIAKSNENVQLNVDTKPTEETYPAVLPDTVARTDENTSPTATSVIEPKSANAALPPAEPTPQISEEANETPNTPLPEPPKERGIQTVPDVAAQVVATPRLPELPREIISENRGTSFLAKFRRLRSISRGNRIQSLAMVPPPLVTADVPIEPEVKPSEIENPAPKLESKVVIPEQSAPDVPQQIGTQNSKESEETSATSELEVPTPTPSVASTPEVTVSRPTTTDLATQHPINTQSADRSASAKLPSVISAQAVESKTEPSQQTLADSIQLAAATPPESALASEQEFKTTFIDLVSLDAATKQISNVASRESEESVTTEVEESRTEPTEPFEIPTARQLLASRFEENIASRSPQEEDRTVGNRAQTANPALARYWRRRFNLYAKWS
jgi:hypothetical protein